MVWVRKKLTIILWNKGHDHAAWLAVQFRPIVEQDSGSFLPRLSKVSVLVGGGILRPTLENKYQAHYSPGNQ